MLIYFFGTETTEKMRLTLRLEEGNKAADDMAEFLEFLGKTENSKFIIAIDLNSKEHLALEFYAHQMETTIAILIESAIRSHFERFLDVF